ncbi:MAG: hypothetical protein JSS70_19170 [Bacteroidetes bacterium]|nr:hypothetical protein [Bacteroidota bacterium]
MNKKKYVMIMNIAGKSFTTANADLSNRWLWVVFICYAFISAFAIANHEMWGDEIHSWNIAKGSFGLRDLFRNIRYEGHPPAWYLIIWTISKFTHKLIYVQAIHWMIATITVFLILFFSPFPFLSRVLIPFGYYFLFEYAIISRNYAIGILLAVCICLIMKKSFRYKTLIYYVLLFLLSNTHLLGILLAGAIHVYYLLQCKEQGKKKSLLYLHTVIGLIIALPAVVFIFPPSDSEMNTQFWLSRWGMRNFRNFSQSPVRAFIPIPPWWIFPFWNFQFMLEVANKYKSFWVVNLTSAIAIIFLLVSILKGNKKSVSLFLANLLFSFIVAMTFFTLGAARYSGFLYISFIVAWWLYCYETPVTKRNIYLVNGLLAFQLFGSVQPILEDIRFPFSNANRVSELINEVSANEKMVTDYWTLNAISAFTDKPFFCIDLQKEISFIIWDGHLKTMLEKRTRVTEGIEKLQEEGIHELYMISVNPPDILSKVDSLLEKKYQVALVDKREGAIERSSNLYLYKIEAR